VAENPSSVSHPSRAKPFRHPNTRFLADLACFPPKSWPPDDLTAGKSHFPVRKNEYSVCKNDYYARKNEVSAYKNDFHAP